MADFTLKKDDMLSLLNATLQDSAGAAVSLTGANVRFRMRLGEGTTWKINSTARVTVVSATAGTVRWSWSTAGIDTDVAGLFYAQWLVTFSGGRTQTFPNDDWTTVLIHPST